MGCRKRQEEKRNSRAGIKKRNREGGRIEE
jgi:hypothetical protein